VRILSRYFASRFLALFALILVVATLALSAVELLLNFDDAMDLRGGADGAFLYLLLRIPSYYLRELVPVASFAASFFALGLASRWHETTAMKAGGISPLRAALPVLGTAALLAAGSFAVNETWVVRATRELRAEQDGSLDFRRGSFWYEREGTVYNVRAADRETRTLRGVSLFERNRDGRLVRSVRAASARILEPGRWRLHDATIRRFEPGRPASAPRVERAERVVLEVGGGDERALLEADPGLLPVGRLREAIALRSEQGEHVHRLVALLHGRLTDPLSVWLLALLAAPLGLRVAPVGGFGAPALAGVAALVVFFLARSVGTTLSAEGLVPPAAGAWSVTLAFAGLGLWQLARIPR